MAHSKKTPSEMTLVELEKLGIVLNDGEPVGWRTNLSQVLLAEGVQCSKQAISNWINIKGRRVPPAVAAVIRGLAQRKK